MVSKYLHFEVVHAGMPIYIKVNRILRVTLTRAYLDWEICKKGDTGLVVPHDRLTIEELQYSELILKAYIAEIREYLYSIMEENIVFNIGDTWFSIGDLQVSNSAAIYYNNDYREIQLIPIKFIEDFLYEDRQDYVMRGLIIERS